MDGIGNTIHGVIIMHKKKEDQLKLEIARELGLLEKIEKEGWKSLSAKETGRIGGMLSRKKKSRAI
jgi:hypothetical protein